MFLMLSVIQQFYSQESNGVVALALPVRNSLKFNRYALNPTFSFVREQNKYISFTNKRQWAQFDNAPQTYLFSYSGRFAENIGAGVGLFQQNFGVLTSFGGMLNFAYNVNFSEDSNLTFGLNIGAYQSGINQGDVILNTPDTVLNNIPSNFAFTVNPGINYGTGFLDFGVAINNLVAYNLSASEIIEENPEQAFQAHVMYTGYMNSRGFFDESKFSTLIRSEFKKDQTILSGIAMLTVPKGIWAQAGYNTAFGASAGLGMNVTKNIAIEYNYEQSMGDLSEFGSSHEITVAYRFDNKYRYSYSDDDQQQSVFNSRNRKTKASSISAEERAKVAERRAAIIAKRKALAEAKAKTPEEEGDINEVENVENKEESKVAETTAENKTIEATPSEIAEETKALEEAETKEEARLKLEAERAEIERQRQQKEAKRKAEIATEKAKAEEEQRKRELEAAKIKAEEERKQLEEAKKRAEAIAAQSKLVEEQKAKAQQEAESKVQKEDEILTSEIDESKVENDISQNTDVEQEPAEKLNVSDNSNQETLAEEEVIPEADDEESQTLKILTEATQKIKDEQRQLLENLSESIAIKQQDLNDLKEENDLSEQGIYQAPKKFKSVAAENAKIEAIKDEIEKIEQEQEAKMIELEALLITRKRKFRKDRQGINDFYKNALEQLKQEQLRIKNYKIALIANLEKIRVATDFERKRRISRAAYDNQQDRYNKDKATLERIKATTQESTTLLTEEDFDFGEEQTKNIQIVNNVVNEEPGYYMVIAVHDDISKRDEFVAKVVASGEKNVNFFFDVKTNRYFIYYEKFDQIEAARSAMNDKGSKPYNTKMSLVKIEN